MRSRPLVWLAGGCAALLMTCGVRCQEKAHTADAATVDTNAVPAQAVETERGGSSVRIVRLSQARGQVRMDRGTGRGLETAFNNIPVVAGAKLVTGQGVAEVEFEDNSSLRLTPDTVVQFTELSRTASGSIVTHVDVIRGVVYVSLEKSKGNAFTLTHGPVTTVLASGAHMRLDADTAQELEVAVFDGSVSVGLGSGTATLTKKQTVTLNPGSGTISAVVRGIPEGDFDPWDKQAQQYHRQVASFAGGGGSGMYGTSDLNYYGSFINMPGCGTMWRPYFANAAWDPFANGIWAWYPAAGYTWVSPYPWGWLPFHSGEWASCGNAGWGWRPGASWYGLNNDRCLRIGEHPGPHPLPPGPPGRNSATLVPVNMRSLTFSGASTMDKFTFRQNSAGLGIQRGEYGSLRSFSAHVDRHGEATGGVSMRPFGSPATMQPGGGAMPTRSSASAGTGRSAGGTGSFHQGSASTSGGGMHGGSMGGGSTGGMHGGGGSASGSAPASASAGGGASSGGHH